MQPSQGSEAPTLARGIHGRPLRTALALYFTLLGFSALATILVLTDVASQASVQIFVSLAFCAVVFTWTIGAFQRIRDGLTRAGEPIWYLAAMGLGCLTFALAVLLTKLCVSAIGIEELSYSQPFLREGYGWGIVFLIMCVGPAVVEELAFRGVILGALRGILGLRDAVIVSALLFMILHLAVLSFPHLFVIGLVLGYLRIRTDSMYPCMVMHFTHNLLVVLAEIAGM